MVKTVDVAAFRKVEAELAQERQLRKRAQQELGGVRSLARKLQLTLLAEREARGEKSRKMKAADAS
jgi:hypothetical protein